MQPLKRIAKGELDGANLEDLSLEILKRHYGQSLGYAKKESYWGIDPKSNQNLFSKLNIKTLNREYFITISRETPERRAICSQNTQTPYTMRVQPKYKPVRQKRPLTLYS